MDNQLVIAMFIGGLVLVALPGFMNMLAARKLKKDDDIEADKEKRLHESFAAMSRELSDERMKRENLAEEVTRLRVEMALTMKQKDLDGVYERLESIQREVKEDLKDYGKTVTEALREVITVLAGRGGAKPQ